MLLFFIWTQKNVAVDKHFLSPPTMQQSDATRVIAGTYRKLNLKYTD